MKLIVSEESPDDIPQVPFDGHSDLLSDSERAVSEEHHSEGSTKSSEQLSSQSFIEPSKAALIDLLDRPRVIHYHPPRRINLEKGT